MRLPFLNKKAGDNYIILVFVVIAIVVLFQLHQFFVFVAGGVSGFLLRGYFEKNKRINKGDNDEVNQKNEVK